MDLFEVIGILNKWKWLLLPVVILVTGYALVTGLQSPKSYSAESSVVFGLSQMANSSSTGLNVAATGDRISATYGGMITSEPVLSKALSKAGIDGSVDTLRGQVSFAQPKNSTILLIDVVDSDPDRAVILANSEAEAVVEYIQQVGQESIDSGKQVVTTELTSIENDMNTLTAQGVQPDDGRIKALLDRRDAMQKRYTALLDQLVSTGDIRVADAARSSQQEGTETLPRTGIAFVISLIVGIALAFIAEAVSKGMRPRAAEETDGQQYMSPGTQVQNSGGVSKSD